MIVVVDAVVVVVVVDVVYLFLFLLLLLLLRFLLLLLLFFPCVLYAFLLFFPTIVIHFLCFAAQHLSCRVNDRARLSINVNRRSYSHWTTSSFFVIRAIAVLGSSDERCAQSLKNFCLRLSFSRRTIPKLEAGCRIVPESTGKGSL